MSVSLSTHVLDTGEGKPAGGVRVELLRGSDAVGTGETDDDGRIPQLAAGLDAGDYRLVFHPPSPFFRRVRWRTCRTTPRPAFVWATSRV